MRSDFLIAQLDAFVFRCPIETPVVTSFGVMRNRPAVFVRAEDTQGNVGWGESWCNFPDVGAEHRARLVKSVFAPLVQGKHFASALDAFNLLKEKTAIWAIQAAEPGPMAQCIAGIDTALWGMTARRAELPLWKLLGGEASRVNVYASGINPDAPAQLELAAVRLSEGRRAFKLKVGFGYERDGENIKAVRDVIGDLPLMVDANQNWDLGTAIEMVDRLEPFNLNWLPPHQFGWLSVRTWPEFDCTIESQALQVIQPNVAKLRGYFSRSSDRKKDYRKSTGFLPILSRCRHRACRIGVFPCSRWRSWNA